MPRFDEAVIDAPQDPREWRCMADRCPHGRPRLAPATHWSLGWYELTPGGAQTRCARDYCSRACRDRDRTRAGPRPGSVAVPDTYWESEPPHPGAH